MKRFFIQIALYLCASFAAAQNYKIEGSAPDMEGKVVYLGDMKSRSNFEKIDSALVSGGLFCMEKPLTEVKRITISIGRSTKTFLLDENPIYITYLLKEEQVKGKSVRLPEITVKGDKDQELFELMTKTLSQEMYAMLAISFMGKDKDVNAPENKALADSIGEIYITAKENTRKIFDSIVTHHRDSYVSGLILNDFLAKERSVAEIQNLYEQLSDRVKQSNVGQTLEKTIQGMQVVGVGKQAPDFMLETPEGERLLLSALRGKCVLIDFWASWCAPCLREAPNIKRVYEKYRDSGFEVLSVSLDERSDQWKQAIRKHGLDWLHVSSLKGWKCPVAKLYQVSAVPAMFLIDREGNIVSTGVRGRMLEQEVEKLCK
ncbi:redoxin domain-containing protein [Bacteroides pyogenes]|uniref:redoxin domain-containing protein n=1 Tax=Bacteroides pyogenes TaxID=310300 RepID=UPI004062963D